MTVIYKLTNQNLQTHDGFQWVPGNWKKTSGGGGGEGGGGGVGGVGGGEL